MRYKKKSYVCSLINNNKFKKKKIMGIEMNKENAKLIGLLTSIFGSGLGSEILDEMINPDGLGVSQKEKLENLKKPTSIVITNGKVVSKIEIFFEEVDEEGGHMKIQGSLIDPKLCDDESDKLTATLASSIAENVNATITELGM